MPVPSIVPSNVSYKRLGEMLLCYMHHHRTTPEAMAESIGIDFSTLNNFGTTTGNPVSTTRDAIFAWCFDPDAPAEAPAPIINPVRAATPKASPLWSLSEAIKRHTDSN